MNYLMEEPLMLQTKDSDVLKFYSTQKWLVKSSQVYMNWLINQLWKPMLMLEKTYMEILSFLEELLCIVVLLKDWAKKLLLLLHQAWKLKFDLFYLRSLHHLKEDFQFGLEGLFYQDLAALAPCGLHRQNTKNLDQELFTENASDYKILNTL